MQYFKEGNTISLGSRENLCFQMVGKITTEKATMQNKFY